MDKKRLSRERKFFAVPERDSQAAFRNEQVQHKNFSMPSENARPRRTEERTRKPSHVAPRATTIKCPASGGSDNETRASSNKKKNRGGKQVWRRIAGSCWRRRMTRTEEERRGEKEEKNRITNLPLFPFNPVVYDVATMEETSRKVDTAI